MISPATRLSGHPWRVLRKGDVQIPVFRFGGDDPSRLYPKHAVRAVAYCGLLEQATGARSPYAIALLAGTYNGWSLPNSPEARSFFDQVLAAARSFLSPNVTIGPPASTGICSGCPHGLPRIYRRGESETILFDGLVRPRGAQPARGSSITAHAATSSPGGRPHDQAVAIGLQVDKPHDAPT